MTVLHHPVPPYIFIVNPSLSGWMSEGPVRDEGPRLYLEKNSVFPIYLVAMMRDYVSGLFLVDCRLIGVYIH